MLQRKVLEPRTLDLLKELMALPSLVSYNLVGGTALALQYGHRRSIDLDFFGNVDAINAMEIQSDLEATGDTQITTQSRIMLGYQIDGVKVDIVKYK